MANIKIGLALSGGGYRAAVFHLGVLRKLNKLNILSKINILSTVSGGSIIGAYYLLNKDDFEKFEKEFRVLLRYNIQYRLFGSLILIGLSILSLVSLLTYYFFNESPYCWFILSYAIILTAIICFILFFNVIPSNKILNYLYNRKFFKNKKLSDFPKEPQTSREQVAAALYASKIARYKIINRLKIVFGNLNCIWYYLNGVMRMMSFTFWTVEIFALVTIIFSTNVPVKITWDYIL